MKNIFFLILASCIIFFVTSTKTSTKSKSKAYLMAQSLLGDYMKLNEKAETLKSKDNYFLINLSNHLDKKFGDMKAIEKESSNLNVRFDDLLKVFTDPAFIEKEVNTIIVKRDEKASNLKK